MSEQPALADRTRQQLEPVAADGLRAYAARTRANADRAAALEDIVETGLPAVEDCTPWEDLREAHLAGLASSAGCTLDTPRLR
ncbi:hypothetical protein KUF83_38795 [Streptomyces sp. BV286]|uniref:hypothetical protein n=1 Tax=Streptomyces sp. BV286 TaxID=2849672 RepID=UPI001C2ECFB0|nr:hypothetical protein [Streptomyces sp. BV286]MBV1942440.1 hypothetical protein [Streptomyces sp. BV286]